jgi:hypothetical protein
VTTRAKSSRAARRFDNVAVKGAFAAYPPSLRGRLMRLRALIFQTAASTPGVGPLLETLKWGQPSYLTAESGSGTTIRIDRVKARADRYALYVHCQTDLVATFRQLYPQSFAYDGNRSIMFALDDKIDEDALRHCVGLALTYHRRKRG